MCILCGLHFGAGCGVGCGAGFELRGWCHVVRFGCDGVSKLICLGGFGLEGFVLEW